LNLRIVLGGLTIRSMGTTRLEERTIGGLHDYLLGTVLREYVQRGMRVVDLGAGSGVLALRLRNELGANVEAVEVDSDFFAADVPLHKLDLNRHDLAQALPGPFDCVISVEVIEHVESPIGFLRAICQSLQPGGHAILTTPNVDNAPARVKFLLTDRVRMMDEAGDPTHISPIFWDLFTRQYVPRSGLRLVQHLVYPRDGYLVTRPSYGWMLKGVARVLPGYAPYGDNHIIVLTRA
jgi:SAM-dependent methyltransferase